MLLSSLTLEELESHCYIENNMQMAKALAQLIDADKAYGLGYDDGHEDGVHLNTV
jgi:hypothetical protein